MAEKMLFPRSDCGEILYVSRDIGPDKFSHSLMTTTKFGISEKEASRVGAVVAVDKMKFWVTV